jgi:hypothetical protein
MKLDVSRTLLNEDQITIELKSSMVGPVWEMKYERRGSSRISSRPLSS